MGIKNFKSLYRMYCETQRGAVLPQTRVTEAEGQPMELNCGDWTVDEYGVRRGSGMSEVVACQFPVLLTRRFENIDTGAEKVELSFCKGGRWRRLVVPCSQYANPRELVRLSDAGLGINLRMAQDLSDYLTDLYALNYETLPLSRSVSRLGWVGEGQFSPFVEDVTFDGGAEYAPVFEATAPCGTLEDWLAAARAFRKESTAARIVLAASFASVLVKPLGALPFFVHLWGVDSSTGKTVALMAAASVWANPEMGKYVKTFDGTDVGYERTAAFLNSLPMCIDELQLSRSVRGRSVFNVYRLTQGAGRTRGTKSGGVEMTPTWANAILTTGETPINTEGVGAGAINRVIEIECTAEHKVVSEGHSVAQVLRQNYGHAGRAFVQTLLEPGNLQRARDVFDGCFALLNQSNTTDKQAMSAALIMTADILATLWLFRDGSGLTGEELAQFLAAREAVSAGVRGYGYLCDWVSTNLNRFDTATGEVLQGDILGKVEGEWVYIIATRYNAALAEAGFDPRAVRSYMAGNGLLRLSGDGRRVVSKKLHGVSTKCVCVKMGG